MYLISTAALIFITRSEFSNIDDNIETLEIDTVDQLDQFRGLGTRS